MQLLVVAVRLASPMLCVHYKSEEVACAQLLQGQGRELRCALIIVEAVVNFGTHADLNKGSLVWDLL